jgi:hypothetical protein
MREGYEMATRFGHRLFAYQFLAVLLEVALRAGEFDAWTAEAATFMDDDAVTPYYASAFLSSRALRLALRGDVGTANEIHNEVVGLVQQLQSQQLDAFVHRERMWLRFLGGQWDEAITSGRIAAANSNFAVDSWWIVAVAAAAGDMLGPLDEAVAGFDPSPLPGPTTAALGAVATAARSLRHGDRDTARAAFTDARTRLLASGELLAAHLAGLLWSRLAPDEPEAGHAGDEAQEFFSARDASSLVQTFDRGFVPPHPASVSRALRKASPQPAVAPAAAIDATAPSSSREDAPDG